MPPLFKLKKGLTIPLAGEAQKVLYEPPPPKAISIKPTDFRGLTPKLLVKEGDAVAAGTPLFAAKLQPNILFTSPVGGTVGAIVRGDKRKLLEVKIDCDHTVPPLRFVGGAAEELSREQIVETLLKSGCWPNIKQRPYGIVANPDHVPKAIFVSAFDTAPLAPDLDFILENEEEMLQTGIDILNKLSPNGLNWSISHRSPTGGVVRKVKNVHFYEFEGKHPSGNVGVQIHHIAPISKGEVVWTIDPQALVIIGRLFATGRLDARKVVAITGPAAQRPCYVSLLSGTPLSSLSKIGLNNSKVRYISGNCLTGDNVGYDGSIGFYHHQITMLPEGDHSEIFGWAKVIRSNTYSVNRSYLSSMTRKKRFSLDTNLHGGVRAFVLSDVYKKVLPMNIYPTYLLKAILVQDIDKMEALGIYEVIEEDFALCEFVCPSKIDIQEIVAQGIELMIKEMS